MRLDRWVLVGLCLALGSCGGDKRCAEDKYYCLPDNRKAQYLSELSDNHLIKLAIIDRNLGRPPSSFSIYELQRRGELRSRDAFYSYADGDTDLDLMNDMVRVFSREWAVCHDWLKMAPSAAQKKIALSCEAVFHGH